MPDFIKKFEKLSNKELYDILLSKKDKLKKKHEKQLKAYYKIVI